MTPWSVRPSAGWPNSAARAASASILQAPSSSEYSEWTCRWAQAGVLTTPPRIGGGPDGPRAVTGPFRARCEDAWRSAAQAPQEAADTPGEPGPGRRRGAGDGRGDGGR